jgi:CRISPR-associated endonuclease Csn1
VKIITKKETIEGYYNGVHRGTGAINIRTHDSEPSFGKNGIKEGVGVKTALTLEKYTVDYFGNRFRVMKEIRNGVADTDDSESDEANPCTGADSPS